MVDITLYPIYSCTLSDSRDLRIGLEDVRAATAARARAFRIR